MTQQHQVETFGSLTGDAVGLILKELVRRAIVAIHNQRHTFVPEHKLTDGKDDVVTSADRLAQAIYIKSLRECFPGIGIVAEEDELKVPCRMEGRQLHAVIDPLDGTRAFARGQFDGVATQIALVEETPDGLRILAAYIGNVNTGEIIGFRPGSSKVQRISDLTNAVELHEALPELPLTKQMALLRDDPRGHSPFTQRLTDTQLPDPAIKCIGIANGSMSLSVIRLCIGEVGMLVMAAGRQTPWDGLPVIGIMRHLGYVSLQPTNDDRGLALYLPELSLKVTHTYAETIWIHTSRVSELMHWARRQYSTA